MSQGRGRRLDKDADLEALQKTYDAQDTNATNALTELNNVYHHDYV